jgi:hypothetical protein
MAGFRAMPEERDAPPDADERSDRAHQATSVPGSNHGDATITVVAVEDVLLSAARESRAGAPHPLTSAAFALGWQMAELYRPPGASRFAGADADDLPDLASLSVEARIEILVDQVQVGLSALHGSIEQTGLPAVSFDALRESLGQGRQARRQAVRKLHRQILGSLTAADFRLGTSYGLGRALADTCRKPTDQHSLQVELSKYRISNLLVWLDDLGSAFPQHAAHAVSVSLERWRDWAEKLGDPQPMPDGTIHALARQGELWRALLSGEKRGTEMLETGNYLDAAHHLTKQMRSVLLGVILRFPILSFGIVALFALGIWLLASGGSSQIVAGASSVLVALGLTWKGLGGALGRLAGKLEQPMWGTVLDGAIANAITLLPGNVQDHRRRRFLATQLPASQDEPEERRPPATAEK